MKREFLQSFKVGDSPLTKEIIDVIMEENGRDINAAKAVAIKPYADFDAIVAENESLKSQQVLCDGKTAAQWKALHDQAVKEHQTQLEAMAFDNLVDNAIFQAGGRNAKAIRALLDLPALQAEQNRQTELEAALQALQRSDSYLFGTETPPPYARGTGTQSRASGTAPETLAGALREKFERK